MSRELYSEGIKHLASILRKAQGRPDAETKAEIDIGYEVTRLREILDALIHLTSVAQQQEAEPYDNWIQFQPNGSIIAYNAIESRWVILRYAAKEEGK